MDSDLRTIFEQFKKRQGDTEDRNSRVLIFDGLNMFIRSFSASPLMDHRGQHIGGLVGFMKSVFSIIKMFRPTRCVIVFDGKDGGKSRRKIFPQYKAGRENSTRLNRFVDVNGIIDEGEQFSRQFRRLEQYLQVIPVSTICIDYIEADDVIGYMSNGYYKRTSYKNITIVSTDRDFLQLVDTNINVYRPTEHQLYDIELMKNRFEISPKNYLTYRTLAGDASDNIPGVEGIGFKTLIKRFPEFKEREIDTEDVIRLAAQKIEEGSKLKAYKNVAAATQQLTLNRELMQLHDVNISGLHKITIDTLMDKPIYPMDKIQFKQMLYDDGINTHIHPIDQWIKSNLTHLDNFTVNE